MTFEQFLQTEGHRVESYVRRFCRRFNVSGSLMRDVRQEALIAAFRAISYWRGQTEGNGAKRPKSAFNWCAGPMRRAMAKAIRAEHGAGIRGCPSLNDRRAGFAEERFFVATGPSLEETLDLRLALQADPKPAQIMRLIMTALSPASGADLARTEQISRQAIHGSAKMAKRRLRAVLG